MKKRQFKFIDFIGKFMYFQQKEVGKVRNTFSTMINSNFHLSFQNDYNAV
jgi:hypothetical protein